MAYDWIADRDHISQIVNGETTYYIKDAEARSAIDTLSSYTKFLGVTTTEITDGTTSAVVIIGGESVTAKKGDIVIYNKSLSGNITVAEEFIYNGAAWSLFGDLSAIDSILGDLAYNSTASASYTPSGTVSVELSSTDGTFVKEVLTEGTVPSFTATPATVVGEVLTEGTVPSLSTNDKTVVTGVSTAGTVPSLSTSDKTVITGVSTAGTVPTFSASLLTAEVNGETLTFALVSNGFNAGAMPTFSTGNVISGVTFDAGAMPTFSTASVVGSTTFDAGSMPTFSSADALTAITVSSAAFAGSSATITVTGSVSKPTPANN